MKNSDTKKIKVLICSLHFGAGHTAHLSTYNKMINECGYEAALYLDKQYMDLFHEFTGNVFFEEEDAKAFCPDIVWIWNVGLEDIHLIKVFKRLNAKIIYVLHEPYMGLRDLMTEGSLIVRKTIANLVNFWICNHAEKIILCSPFAVKQTEKYMRNMLKKSIQFPLLFMDDMISDVERKYFSLIGAFSHPHGSDLFLNFVKNSEGNNEICFQIATRSDIGNILKDKSLQRMIDDGRLIIQQGRPLTEKEMNEAYRKSICTWNGYRHCMQSGVLANSFMQGTPVVATHLGSFDEYIKDGYNGAFIDNFTYESIFHAYQQIASNIDAISSNCRDTFLNNFYYKNQEARFKDIVKEIIG